VPGRWRGRPAAARALRGRVSGAGRGVAAGECALSRRARRHGQNAVPRRAQRAAFTPGKRLPPPPGAQEAGKREIAVFRTDTVSTLHRSSRSGGRSRAACAACAAPGALPRALPGLVWWIQGPECDPGVVGTITIGAGIQVIRLDSGFSGLSGSVVLAGFQGFRPFCACAGNVF
jgi:hypothetical protein